MSNWPGKRENKGSLATWFVFGIYDSIVFCLSDKGGYKFLVVTAVTWFGSLERPVAVVLVACFFTSEDFFSVDICKENSEVKI